MKMNDNKIVEAEEVKSAKLDNTIDPEMIVMDDDSDMPEPETKSYEKLIRCTNMFMQLFHETVDTLPYATILKNSNNDQIKLIDLVKYIEQKYDRMPIEEMDKIVSFIANLDFKHARPLMEIIEDQNKQSILWEPVD